MSSIFSVHELSIVLLVRNQNPALLNLDFLKCSGIVPQDWELASSPILTQQGSQIIFQNGLRLVADTNRTIFLESTIGKSFSNITVAQVAKHYVQRLPYAQYDALGINPEGFATFPNNPELAQNYISKSLLSPGAWLEFGNTPPRTDLNIVYTLEQGTLSLKVAQRSIQKENEEAITPIVTYTGNFEYIFQQVPPTDKLDVLCNRLDQWQSNIETFTTLIEQRFLNAMNSPLLSQSIDPLTGQPIKNATAELTHIANMNSQVPFVTPQYALG
ncbi:hypothetical protein DSM106972_020320 [Dulcicalothrix desertica PCC 7102]|uniref:Uncharacterized protein n=1 Tax=Dulcicalothrix desertica PCC 7102 TaxID=232991 RepID=A0A433VP20_9CYAN|nr:hypothetical protein [Dulcicalothrix desertica]RUT07772.1 hypothetical protein DSM106972_020320 [Dulcicalothrix desertica PCC 7102]TWH39299.1 hypothetical protein CAL7102_08520 [Dulcicalothrix desertica PCC 7102]